MKKMFFGLAVLAIFSAGAAIFAPMTTMDDTRQFANELKARGAEGSQGAAGRRPAYGETHRATVYGTGNRRLQQSDKQSDKPKGFLGSLDTDKPKGFLRGLDDKP